MRKVKVKEESEKWPLIIDRSSQQAMTMSKQSPTTPGREPLKDLNHPCTTASAALSCCPHSHHCLRRIISSLLILAIGLLVFDTISRRNVIFDVENNGSNILYEYEFYCDALSSRVSIASDTIGAATATLFNCGAGCVGLGELNADARDLTTVGIESEIIFDSGETPHTPQSAPDVTAPPHLTPHTIHRTRPVGVGLREFDDNEYVFNENEFNNEINNIFNNLECDLSVVQTATTIATATDENENKIKYASGWNGPHTYTQTKPQTQNSTSPVIDSNDRMDKIGIESHELIILVAYLIVILTEVDYNTICYLVCLFYFFNCFVVECQCCVSMSLCFCANILDLFLISSCF